MQQDQDKDARAAADFPKVAAEYLNDLYSRHPTIAAASGLHTWDSQLEDLSSHAINDEISAIQRFQSRLQKIPPLQLCLSDLLDLQILASNMKSRRLELEQIKNYERNPGVYSDVLSGALLQIASFGYAPAETRLRAIIDKEKQVPRFLDAARTNVRHVPPVYLKVAREAFKGTLDFVKSDLPAAFQTVADPGLQAEFRKSTQIAADALAKHLKHLSGINPDPAATFAIGKLNYEAKLRYDEGLDIPVEKLLAIANRELAKTQEEFRRTAALIDSRRNARDVWAGIQRDHPKAGSLVSEAGKQLETLVRFITEKRIVTLPDDRTPVVAPTPDFMRWSTASMWTPGPFERGGVQARYLVTDVNPKWTEQQKEEYLGSLNYPQLWTTSIHEAYPGHYVQGMALRQVTSPVRKTLAIAPGTFVEGWAHYAEQMMFEEGFGGGDPKLKMGQLGDALLRLGRFVVGIREHTGGMTVDEATRFFMDNAYMGETPSRIEAERGTFDPTYLVYSVGKLAILKLREDYRRYRGKEFSLEEFHDLLLADGNAPLWVHRQLLMPGDKGRLIE